MDTRHQSGIAEDKFVQDYQSCNFILRRNNLLVKKLRRDLHSLFEENISVCGAFSTIEDCYGTLTSRTAANELLKHSLRVFLLEAMRLSNLFPDMSEIIGISAKVAGAKNIPILHDVFRHYQYLGSLSCNLHAAVMRLLGLITMIHGLDWSRTI